MTISAETRLKMSIAAKNHAPRSQASYEKWRAGNIGRKHHFKDPESRRQKLIAAGRSPELRQLRREAALKLWQSRTPEELAEFGKRIASKLRGAIINENQRRGLLLGQQVNKGETHWNYKGGKSRPPYPKEYRQLRPLILERDGYRCVMCGDEKKNAVHHIDHNKQHNTFLNLVTLCRGCNVRAESRVNKETWPIVLRAYIEGLIEKKEVA